MGETDVSELPLGDRQLGLEVRDLRDEVGVSGFRLVDETSDLGELGLRRTFRIGPILQIIDPAKGLVESDRDWSPLSLFRGWLRP